MIVEYPCALSGVNLSTDLCTLVDLLGLIGSGSSDVVVSWGLRGAMGSGVELISVGDLDLTLSDTGLDVEDVGGIGAVTASFCCCFLEDGRSFGTAKGTGSLMGTSDSQLSSMSCSRSFLNLDLITKSSQFGGGVSDS